MKHQVTQIRPLPVVAGDGKLPLPLADTGLPLYTRAMNAIDRLEEGIHCCCWPFPELSTSGACAPRAARRSSFRRSRRFPTTTAVTAWPCCRSSRSEEHTSELQSLMHL